MARRFINLEKSIISTKEATEEDMAGFTTQRLDIEADEPPPLKVLERAMGYNSSEYVKIEWYQRITAQFFDLMEHKIHSKHTV